MTITIDRDTILKFDVPGPRYTSYPTAPVWSDEVDETVYIRKLKDFGLSDKTLSLYIHIPFCQSMCTYCGCNVVIRRQDERYADEYLKYLFKEIDLVSRYIGVKKKVRQLHWGGGTPTYLSERQIESLFAKVTGCFDVDLNGEVAIEVDPRTVDKSKVVKLRALGFNRVSMGVQDFDPQVQKAVNRPQSYASVKDLTDWCREQRFNSVNFDLIYGLPRQTAESFSATAARAADLKPDRIALYSFAYVPWLKKHQNKIDRQSLPSNDVKLDIFLRARARFLESGYQAIAMDHFALQEDELAKAFNAGELYRNFMGYTVKPADEYIGLGLTSIGFLENTYVHNHKALPEYYRRLREDKLPVERGKVLSRDDRIRRWTINSLICQFQVDRQKFQDMFQVGFNDYFIQERDHIRRCVEDGLISLQGGRISVTELGRIFIRNVCMGFDLYLRQEGAHRRFSRTV
jgi:oxygen-independent coproporphyrinogen-3 oxidase